MDMLKRRLALITCAQIDPCNNLVSMCMRKIFNDAAGAVLSHA